jgi:hypothetical protein
MLALAMGGCALGGSQGSEQGTVMGWSAGVVSRTLPVCEVGRSLLTLDDGTVVYVEPEEIMRLASGILMAGTPTYAWAPGSGPSWDRVQPDAHLAVLFDREGRARVIEKPIAGAIGAVRAVALGGDRWATVFAEIHPDSLPESEFLLDTWYAEHDGRRWTLVERLPPPARGRLEFATDSELVRTRDGLAWVTGTRFPNARGELVQYERRNGAWSVRVVSDAWVEVTALAYDPRERILWMAHFSEDPDLPGWQQSFRLYRSRDGGAWELAARLAVAERDAKVREPRLSVLPGGLAVAWLTFPPTPDAGLEARVRLGIRRGQDGTEVSLDPDAFDIHPLGEPGGHPTWLVNHLVDHGRSAELTVVRVRRSHSITVESGGVPNPYPSFFAALALGDDEIVVVGPEVDRDPEAPTVRSLVIRLSTSCT